MGSSITYARRYCLSAAIGLVADEDDDGNAASQAKPSPERQITRAPTTLPQPATITDIQIIELVSQAAGLNVSEAQLVASDSLKRPLEKWDVPAYAKAKAQLHAKETNLRIAKEQAELAKGNNV
jgi:hypothetical protein